MAVLRLSVLIQLLVRTLASKMFEVEHIVIKRNTQAEWTDDVWEMWSDDGGKFDWRKFVASRDMKRKYVNEFYYLSRHI